MFNGPTIRIEIEHMREAILHQFINHQDEITKAVESQLKLAIEKFDFAGEIEKQTNECLKTIISQYFQYGSGERMLRELTKESLDKIFNLKEK